MPRNSKPSPGLPDEAATSADKSPRDLDTGRRLKAVREAHGWSQRELAKRAGITNSAISMVEQGQVSPSVQSLARILAAFPMDLAEFLRVTGLRRRRYCLLARKCRLPNNLGHLVWPYKPWPNRYPGVSWISPPIYCPARPHPLCITRALATLVVCCKRAMWICFTVSIASIYSRVMAFICRKGIFIVLPALPMRVPAY